MSHERRLSKAFSRLEAGARANHACRYLCVKRAGLLEKVALEDINYFKGSGSYTTLMLHSGSEKLHDKNPDRLLALLPESIVRIHKSYLVDSKRIAKLRSYPGSKYAAILDNGDVLPVGRGRYKELKKLIFQ